MEAKFYANITRKGDGGVAPEYIAFAGIEFSESSFTSGGYCLNFAGVAEYGCGSCAAKVDIKAAPDTVGVGLGKTGDTGADYAAQYAAGAVPVTPSVRTAAASTAVIFCFIMIPLSLGE